MKLNKQVTSLELSKRLRELGAKQDSLFFWIKGLDISEYPSGNDYESWYEKKYKELINKAKAKHAEEVIKDWDYEIEGDCYIELYSAFTVAELGEMLPEIVSDDKGYIGEIIIKKVGNEFVCAVFKGNICQEIFFKDDNESNARAKMMVYLLENNLK